jgi:hypothetical protein
VTLTFVLPVSPWPRRHEQVPYIAYDDSDTGAAKRRDEDSAAVAYLLVGRRWLLGLYEFAEVGFAALGQYNLAY